MKTPRDDASLNTSHWIAEGEVEVCYRGNSIGIRRLPYGEWIYLRRADFHAVIDKYIGTDEIRAYIRKRESDPLDEWRASVIRRMAENTDRLMSRRS